MANRTRTHRSLVAERFPAYGNYARQGMEIEQIAAGMGVSRRMVQKILRRAERKFREEWLRLGEVDLTA